MNPAIAMNFLFGGMKKYIVICLCTMAIVVALPVMAVLGLGTSTLSFLLGTPSAEAAETLGFYMGDEVPGDTYAWGNCTYWVFAMRLWAGHPIPVTWGDANTWDDQARADDYIVDHTPTPGSIYQTDAGKLGHVAYVTNVTVDGTWTISEMNVKGLNIVDTRTFASKEAQYANFIHDKKGAPAWNPLPISIPSINIGT